MFLRFSVYFIVNFTICRDEVLYNIDTEPISGRRRSAADDVWLTAAELCDYKNNVLLMRTRLRTARLSGRRV